MSDWQPIETAPKILGRRYLVCWAGTPDSFYVLMWKHNGRISRARARGEDVGDMLDEYFGDSNEMDDYDLARPASFPPHWLDIPDIPN